MRAPWSARRSRRVVSSIVVGLALAAYPAERARARTEAEQSRASEGPPSEATLGIPVYPTADFLTSYDAGRGQRYYLFGTETAFEEMVRYYGVILDERGDRVFDAPATHVFEVGRFREDEMAFPPSVTIKDYRWNGSDGYLHPVDSATRYPTIIQIVPVPADER